jgi:hypothetical protein
LDVVGVNGEAGEVVGHGREVNPPGVDVAIKLF